MSTSVPLVVATLDPGLDAVLLDLTPLVYGAESAGQGVATHVRAASAVRRVARRLVILQDDVDVLAFHWHGERTEALVLPVGAGEGRRQPAGSRRDKRTKMDLEACAVLPDGRLVGFGSGSTPARERLVVLAPEGEVRVVDSPQLYAALRSEPAFSGSELNVEGALVVGDVVRLFQRGNGAPIDGRLPVNATGDLALPGFLAWLDRGAALPEVEAIVQYDLGALDGVPFTFTDAALMNDGRIACLACAEDSPDTFRDGEVLGSRLGILDGLGLRVAPVVEPDGRLSTLKLEGIETRPGAETAFDVVVDMDRPDEPALLGRLAVREEPVDRLGHR